jgi:hypothetical protein
LRKAIALFRSLSGFILALEGANPEHEFPASSESSACLSLITGGARGLTKATPCLVDLIEFFKETAPRVNSRSPAIIDLDFKKAFDRVTHKRLILQVSKYVMVREQLERVRDLSQSWSQRGQSRNEQLGREKRQLESCPRQHSPALFIS